MHDCMLSHACTYYIHILHYYFTIICIVLGKPGVWWFDDINRVWLSSPTIIQCDDVMSRLIKEQQTGKEWSICIESCSPESACLIFNCLNKCSVWRLNIVTTSLDSTCMSTLFEVLRYNKQTKELRIASSPLANGIKQVTDALLFNNSLEKLLTKNLVLTDKDISHLSNMLSANKTLKVLNLHNCNITDKGVRYICQGLVKNQTLSTLNISGNCQITSDSTSAIVDLMHRTTSLTVLCLYNTSLSNDDIKTICTKNTTVQIQYLCEPLSKRHSGLLERKRTKGSMLNH